MLLLELEGGGEGLKVVVAVVVVVEERDVMEGSSCQVI